MRRPTSGDQFTIRCGTSYASIASVGASLRELVVDGRHLVVPYEADELRPMQKGALLAPWPNRVVGGTYEFRGVRRQLAITEPATGHAAQGLVAWQEFAVPPRAAEEQAADRVRLRTFVEPTPGYPWRVEVSVLFELDADGLTQTVTGRNLGHGTAPWGCGSHPYLRAGDSPLDEWTLRLPAEQYLAVDATKAPTLLLPVVGDYDRREPRPLGTARIDNAYTDLGRDEHGRAAVEVLEASGEGVRLLLDERCGWVQVYTADRPGGADDPNHRSGLAVEPMTCAPDAYNSGHGLVELPEGGESSASWRIEAVRVG